MTALSPVLAPVAVVEPYGPCDLCAARPETIPTPDGSVLLLHRSGLACHVTIRATSDAKARELWAGYTRGERG